MTRDWLDVKYDKKYRDEIKRISARLYPHGTLKDDRRATIQLVKIHCSMAQELTDKDLLGGGGAYIGTDLCVLLGMRWVDNKRGIESGCWITEKDEPQLYELLNISSDLDVDSNQPDKWARLFEVASHIDA